MMWGGGGKIYICTLETKKQRRSLYPTEVITTFLQQFNSWSLVCDMKTLKSPNSTLFLPSEFIFLSFTFTWQIAELDYTR